MPLLEANGKYLIVPTITNKMKLLPIPHLDPMAKKATPRAIEGIKYGKKAKLSKSFDKKVPRFFATAYPTKTPREPAMMAQRKESKREFPKAFHTCGSKIIPLMPLPALVVVLEIQNSKVNVL